MAELNVNNLINPDEYSQFKFIEFHLTYLRPYCFPERYLTSRYIIIQHIDNLVRSSGGGYARAVPCVVDEYKEILY